MSLTEKVAYLNGLMSGLDINDSTPEDTWAKMAKTRIIALQSEGKAE